MSKQLGVQPVWIAACDTYDVQRIAAVLQPVVRDSIGRAANAVCVLVDAPFADSRLAPLASVDPRFLQGLLATLPSRELTVAARSLPGFPTRFTLRRAGYGAVARSGARLLPLEDTNYYAVTVPSSGATLHLPVAYLDAAVRIVVTRLKPAVFPRLNLGGRTLLSVLPEQQRADTAERSAERVADVMEVAPPHLILVDAIEAGHDGNELTCRPKPMGVIFAGANVFAVDRAAAEAVGVPSEQLLYLHAGARRGQGPAAVDALSFQGTMTLEAVRRRGTGFTLPPDRPDGMTPPGSIRVVVGDGATPAGSAGILTVALQVIERAGGFAGARETTLVVGRTQQEQRAGSDQAALVFIGDDAGAPYRGFSRVARLRGAPVRLRALLNDLPFIMRLSRPLDPLLLPLTAAAARATLAQLVRRPQIIPYPGRR